MNLESQRRQYELVEKARGLGFASTEVIDDDLGRSAANRSRTERQKALRWKSLCHHVRHRFRVRADTESSTSIAPAAQPSGGESSISASATYTRRPRKRTEAGVVRFSHRPHVKLSRREYSSSTEGGQPRGLRG